MYLTTPERCAQLIAAAVATPLQILPEAQDAPKAGPSGLDADVDPPAS